MTPASGGETTPQSFANRSARLFVAIKCPSALVRPLAALQRRWQKGLPRRLVRWVSEHQFHITLLFFGRVARERMDELAGRLAEAIVARPALPLGLIGVGVFPDWRHPRVLWAGVDGELDGLAALQQRIQEAGRTYVEKPEERRFHAHVTLGRVMGRERPDGEAVRRAAGRDLQAHWGSWQATEVVLMSSELRPGGSVYSDLATFPLRPAL